MQTRATRTGPTRNRLPAMGDRPGFRSSFERTNADRGSVLFLSLIIVTLILLVLGAATSTTVSMGRAARGRLERTQAVAIADGVVETVLDRVLEREANFLSLETSGTVRVAAGDHEYTTTLVGGPYQVVGADGVASTVEYYEVSSSVEIDGNGATVRRIAALTLTPIFQYMILYEGDLEILPGADMVLNGRVHANGDLYVGSGSTLTADTEHFRCTGNILRQRKDDGSTTGGVVNIRVAGNTTYVDMESDRDSTYSNWTTYALSTWNGTVQDGAHGVRESAVPEIASFKAFSPDGSRGYFHREAGLVIADGVAYDGDGNTVSLPNGTVAERTMYDGREGRTVTVTEVDLGLLNTSGHYPANGLLYAYRTDASPSQPNGVRLTNGSTLAQPLTVVSDDPVYIHGDFNTVDKKSAAVMADAVNLLSNAWDDTKAAGNLPFATDTTYNVAFVTGKVPTPDGGGNYSGGFENLPRFHEDWTGRTARIRGSFASIFDSEVAQSPWKYGGDVYTEPIRDWAYDTALSGAGNQPPFTPNGVTLERVLWDDGLPLLIE